MSINHKFLRATNLGVLIFIFLSGIFAGCKQSSSSDQTTNGFFQNKNQTRSLNLDGPLPNEPDAPSQKFVEGRLKKGEGITRLRMGDRETEAPIFDANFAVFANPAITITDISNSTKAHAHFLFNCLRNDPEIKDNFDRLEEKEFWSIVHLLEYYVHLHLPKYGRIGWDTRISDSPQRMKCEGVIDNDMAVELSKTELGQAVMIRGPRFDGPGYKSDYSNSIEKTLKRWAARTSYFSVTDLFVSWLLWRYDHIFMRTIYPIATDATESSPVALFTRRTTPTFEHAFQLTELKFSGADWGALGMNEYSAYGWTPVHGWLAQYQFENPVITSFIPILGSLFDLTESVIDLASGRDRYGIPTDYLRTSAFFAANAGFTFFDFIPISGAITKFGTNVVESSRKIYAARNGMLEIIKSLHGVTDSNVYYQKLIEMENIYKSIDMAGENVGNVAFKETFQLGKNTTLRSESFWNRSMGYTWDLSREFCRGMAEGLENLAENLQDAANYLKWNELPMDRQLFAHFEEDTRAAVQKAYKDSGRLDKSKNIKFFDQDLLVDGLMDYHRYTPIKTTVDPNFLPSRWQNFNEFIKSTAARGGEPFVGDAHPAITNMFNLHTMAGLLIKGRSNVQGYIRPIRGTTAKGETITTGYVVGFTGQPLELFPIDPYTQAISSIPTERIDGQIIQHSAANHEGGAELMRQMMTTSDPNIRATVKRILAAKIDDDLKKVYDERFRLFAKILDPKTSKHEAIDLIAEYHWWSIASLRLDSGSNSFAELSAKALMIHKGINFGGWHPVVSSDFLALGLQKDEFVRNYKLLFDNTQYGFDRNQTQVLLNIIAARTAEILPVSFKQFSIGTAKVLALTGTSATIRAITLNPLKSAENVLFRDSVDDDTEGNTMQLVVEFQDQAGNVVTTDVVAADTPADGASGFSTLIEKKDMIMLADYQIPDTSTFHHAVFYVQNPFYGPKSRREIFRFPEEPVTVNPPSYDLRIGGPWSAKQVRTSNLGRVSISIGPRDGSSSIDITNGSLCTPDSSYGLSRTRCFVGDDVKVQFKAIPGPLGSFVSWQNHSGPPGSYYGTPGYTNVNTFLGGATVDSLFWGRKSIASCPCFGSSNPVCEFNPADLPGGVWGCDAQIACTSFEVYYRDNMELWGEPLHTDCTDVLPNWPKSGQTLERDGVISRPWDFK